MPTGCQLDGLLLYLAAGVAPVEIDCQRRVSGVIAQPPMKIGTAFAGLTIAAIDHANQRLAARQVDAGKGANGRATDGVGAGLTAADDSLALLIKRQKQV